MKLVKTFELSNLSNNESGGVSVVICCHNGVSRLRPTIEHVAAQIVRPGLPWEVILVDNASTDGTGEFATQCWPVPGPAPFRILREPRLGKMFGFQLACSAARYEV